ncbi:uncharacterized protein [Typha angustifolia]|uniref:uncharacterized protein n=1 Tax=Typha angustifolia TaxID=59011 RepID=UPI003C2FD90A
MLVKLSASPLLSFEASALCFFSSQDASTSTSNLALPIRKCGIRTNILPYIVRKRSENLISTRGGWKILSVDQAQHAVLEDDEKKTWEASKQILCGLNFTVEESDVMLKKAFGWAHSPYWGEERRKEVPRMESVSEVLEYIKSFGLSNDDLYKLLKKFPEVLGCNLDEEVKLNISTLEREWGIKGKALRNLLLRNPKVLGYNVDCKGDCMAQCTRCWVRF